MTALRRALPLLALLFVAGPAAAFDVGDPSFRTGDADPHHRIEFLFDSMDRGIRLSSNHVLAGSAAGGPVGSFAAPGERGSSMDGESVLVRYSCYPMERLSAQFDLGYNGQSSGGDETIVLGGAVRWLLFREGPVQLGAQASAHFVPEVSTQERGVDPTLGGYVANGEGDFHEFGLALLGSLDLPTRDDWLATIYAGPRLSQLRGDFRAVTDYENPIVIGGTTIGSRAWFSGAQKESSLFSAVLGLRINYGKHWMGRIETRLLDESSFSASVGANF